MLFRMNNLRVGLESRRTLEEAAARQLGIVPQKIRRVTLLKKAIDARRKKSITFVYHLLLDLELTNGERSRLEKKQLILPYKRAQTPKPQIGSEKLHGRPLVVGLGPAGLMAALELAENGYHPLVVERGRDLAHRVKDVETFWQTGQLDPVSNVQFGAGGAGTFSDGKLTTRVNDPIVGHILETFVAAGAPEEILYEQKPHVGTDRLRIMVTGLIHRIKKAGGEIRYETQVTDFHLDSKKGLTAVTLNGRERLETNGVILAADTAPAIRMKPFIPAASIWKPRHLLSACALSIVRPSSTRLNTGHLPRIRSWGLLTMPSSIMTRPAGLFIPSACARAAKSLPPALR